MFDDLLIFVFRSRLYVVINLFNVGQNRGKCAGQTIMWPHVHFIPRKDGDIKNGQKGNGIRLSFPNGDHKEYY